MFELIRNEFAMRPSLQLTTRNDWQHWAKQYEPLTVSERNAISQIIAAHSGIPQAIVQQHLELNNQENPDFIVLLHEYEQKCTDKIAAFHQKTVFQEHDFSPLAISRTEWLVLINKFESLKRHSLNLYFLMDGLSTLRKVSFDSVLNAIKKERLSRYPQAQASATAAETLLPVKRNRQSFFTAESNPLILDGMANPHIQQALKTTGIRITDLKHATPEKGYSNLMSTQSGKKVRPLCEIRGTRLFKPITPYGKPSEEARADFRQASTQAILIDLPRLNNKRAEEVEFTATLKGIEERANKRRRRSQNSIMGASARDVFEAHGIEVSYEHKNEHHWAHLIAHFLCDSSEVRGKSDEVINLIAATAESNYNILKVIECFIRDTLKNHETEEIHIHVLPRYSGESLIPDQLIYTLNWNTVNSEGTLTPQTNIYYINPQSYAKITKVMQASINALNQAASETSSADTDEEDLDESFTP